MNNYKETESCANNVQDSTTNIYQIDGCNLAVTSKCIGTDSLTDLMFQLIKNKINAQ